MKKYFYILLISIIFLISFGLSAQENKQYEIGTPFIRNYPPRDYKAFSQNWSIVQDHRGIMYFANGDGVLEYDGVNWRLIPIKDNYTVSSLAIDKNGVIYVGSINEFGYLAPDINGLMKYISLTQNIKETQKDFGFISNIIIVGKEEIIFVASKSIFKLSFINENFKIKEYPYISSVYKVSDILYSWHTKTGLSLLINDTILPLKGGDFFINKSVQTILDYNESKLLISTRNEGMFLINKIEPNNFNKTLEISPFPTQMDEFLFKNKYQNALKLHDGNFAFATMRGGTVIMDKHGNLIQLLNKAIGIYNDTHYFIFQDSEEALWFALDNGISKAETNSPITFWNDATGLRGSVLSLTRFNDVIYAATWQGVYYLDVNGFKNGHNDNSLDVLVFKPVKGIASTCWDFLDLNFKTHSNILLVASKDGIFKIDKDTATSIYKGSANKLHRIGRRADIILAGLESGALLIKMDTSGKEVRFNKPELIKEINQRVISIGETKKNEIWLGTQYNGVIFLKENILPNDSIGHNYKPIFYTKYNNHLINGSVFINDYFGRLLFTCENGLFYFTDNGFFKPYNKTLNNILVNRGIVTVFKQDMKGNLWLQGTLKSNGEKIIVCIIKKSKTERVFRTLPFKPIPKAEIWNFYTEKNGITWLCSDEGLFRYNSNISYYYQKEFNTLVRNVFLETDSLYYGGYDTAFKQPFNSILSPTKDPIKEGNKIKHSYNSVLFKFASLFFYDESQNKYKYYLEGFDKKWSDWSSENKKEYTNLPSGKYKFRVYSKNIFEKEGKEDFFEFEILSPWYRTFWVYLLYLIILGCFVYLIIKFGNKKLVEAKLRLENLVQERTAEIVLQKRELEKEKEKSDRLLLNILPYKIAEELKENGFAKAKHYEQVSVMFADFTGFTQIAEQMEPEELIKELNKCFVYFDEVCVRHNLEKIKTVGDSYMCAGGIPIKNCTNPVDIILAALEMIDFIKKLNEEQEKKGVTKWHIRIGINTGEIIAGVVGKKKFAYDIWGDTVNTASRLETTSEPDKINISGSTYKFVNDFFVCEYRGKVAAKHKGVVDMNFVYRIKPELSHDEEGYIPNIKFKEMYNKLLKEC